MDHDGCPLRKSSLLSRHRNAAQRCERGVSCVTSTDYLNAGRIAPAIDKNLSAHRYAGGWLNKQL